MKKKIIYTLAILAIIGYFGFRYVMAPPPDISKQKTDFNLTALNLAKEFVSNENGATARFKEKVITVSGKITSLENKSLTIDSKVTCGFENKPNVKKGQIVKVKGLFIGFDEMFEEVKLDKCSVIK